MKWRELFRNPEIKLQCMIYAGITAIAAAAAAAVWDPWCALYVSCMCLGGAGVSIWFTGRRYRRLSVLSTAIDEVLYGNDSMGHIPDEEGELAVLASKIHKMTIRLRDQAEELKREKIYLQESLADISHQVKTPLTSIHMLLLRLKEEEDRRERAGIYRSIGNLLSRTEWLIASLLKIARLESGTVSLKSGPVRAEDVIKKAVEPLEVPMELKGQNLVLRLEREAAFKGDLLWSVEAVGNIIKNCMEHTPQNGTITVSAKENPIYTEIQIEDTGEGFSKTDLNHLFQRFYRGKKDSSDSVGIGLALSGMIIKGQNGTVQAANRQEGGARFCIRFYKHAPGHF